MEKNEIDKLLGYLSELGSFLSRIKFRDSELKEDKAVESDGFNFALSRRCAELEDYKLNRKTGNRQPWTDKEKKEMPFLKDLKYRVTQNGIHQFRYRRDGYNESFNSKNYEEAKKKAYDFIKSIKKLIKNESENVRGHSLDFIARSWLELKRAHTARETWRVYNGIYENHIAPVFGKRSIKNILPLDLQPFFNNLFARQEKTCEDCKIVLNGIFKYAIANRMILSNPMEGVIVERHYRVNGSALSNDQIERFKKKMFEGGKYGVAGLIIIYTGIRGSELESLTFDWDNGTFTVKNAKLKKSQKTKASNLTRTVPIFPSLYKIKDLILSTEGWNIKAKTLSCRFRRLWNETTIKDLRHTFISKARETGIDNELVNLWTGHLGGPNVTATVYTHFNIDFQKIQAMKFKPF